MNLRIGINTLYLIPGKVGGTETYLRNLIHHLQELDTINEYFLFTNVENSGSFDLWSKNFREILCPIRASIRAVRILWEQLIIPFQVWKYRLSLLHSPGYTAPLYLSCPSVVTIHDLNYHFHPEDFSWAALWVHRFLVPMAAKRCSKVFTGSHFSEQSIRHILGTPQEKVTTIYYAADGNFREEMTPQDIDQMKKTFGLGGDFILSITGSYPHKNLGGLLEAYRVLCENYRMEMPLVLVGVKGTSHSVVAKWTAQNPHCGRVVVTGWLASKDLAGLYSSALFFVFPSKYEGFGFPVLEAMGFGLPVISSSAASLPELVGDAGILVDPESPESLAEAMLKCLNDSFLRKQLSEKGRERFKKFSWKETVKQTLREYMAVIRNGVS